MPMTAQTIDNESSSGGGLLWGDQDRQLSANIRTPEIADNYPIVRSHRL